MIFKVDSSDEYISSVSLKNRISRRNVEASLLSNFQAELALAYEDLGDYSAILNNTPSFFEHASFFIEENGDFVQHRLHIGDFISINTAELGDNFAIIRAIFCHQKNDNRYAFIIVDWFEEINQSKLGCPVYRLRIASNRRRIFSISVVGSTNNIHFVHNCKDNECAGGNHDFRNNLYIRNMYIFKAV